MIFLLLFSSSQILILFLLLFFLFILTSPAFSFSSLQTQYKLISHSFLLYFSLWLHYSLTSLHITLSCILSHPILSHLILSYLIWLYLIWSHLLISYLILSHLISINLTDRCEWPVSRNKKTESRSFQRNSFEHYREREEPSNWSRGTYVRVCMCWYVFVCLIIFIFNLFLAIRSLTLVSF